MNDLTEMKYTFQMPLTGEITIEGSEEDLRHFLDLLQACIDDAITYNRHYAGLRAWPEHLDEIYNCILATSPFTEPDLDLPF